MWAGGRVLQRRGLVCGEAATRRSTVLDQIDKVGRSGNLTFVTVGHEIFQHGQLCIEENQNIVYRDAASTPEPARQARATEEQPTEDEWSIEVTPLLLFRFSALTYNAHRIHYDREYTTSVEGYPGLVTHGPLQAIAMAEHARAHQTFTVHQDRARFEYRLLAPLFDHEGLIVSGRDEGTAFVASVRDKWGRHTAAGTFTSAAGHDLATRSEADSSSSG